MCAHTIAYGAAGGDGKVGSERRQINPQSLNRYSYVLNNPMNSVDPSGLCGLVVAGFKDTPDNSQAILDYARSIGANVVFPYANASVPADVLSIAGQDLGFSTTAGGITESALAASASEGPVSVVTFSGGAQSFSSALSDYGSANLTSAVYVEPGTGVITGLFTGLPQGTDQSAILRGHGFLEGFLGAITRSHGIPTSSIDCKHNANCAFGLLNNGTSPVQPQAAPACKDPQIFTPSGNKPLNPPRGGGGSSGGGGGPIFWQPWLCGPEGGCSVGLGTWILGGWDNGPHVNAWY